MIADFYDPRPGNRPRVFGFLGWRSSRSPGGGDEGTRQGRLAGVVSVEFRTFRECAREQGWAMAGRSPVVGGLLLLRVGGASASGGGCGFARDAREGWTGPVLCPPAVCAAARMDAESREHHGGLQAAALFARDPRWSGGGHAARASGIIPVRGSGRLSSSDRGSGNPHGHISGKGIGT